MDSVRGSKTIKAFWLHFDALHKGYPKKLKHALLGFKHKLLLRIVIKASSPIYWGVYKTRTISLIVAPRSVMNLSTALFGLSLLSIILVHLFKQKCVT